MKCERCDGAGGVCTDCNGSGRRYEECGQCGKRFEFETGSGDVCPECIELEAESQRRPKERDWDLLIDERRGK